MDVKYINPFMTAIRNVFNTMLNMDVEFDKPHVRTAVDTTHDVSGVIGLSGDVDGVVIVSFPRLAATRIASTFAGVDLSETDDDFADAIGELANMISGNAKKDFDGLQVFISPPSVVVGSSQELKNILAQDMQAVKAARVRAVPTLFINGIIPKSRSLGTLSRMVQEELKRKK